ncbi:MAG: RT0821/Lpp0805 family surface protein [Rickettsiales bacterium]
MALLKKTFSFASLCAVTGTLFLQGCAQQGGGAYGGGYGSGGSGNIFTKENIGTVAGAVGGAWVGSNIGKGKGNIAAIAAGTLLGAALGKNLGASLDSADMARYNRTSQYALESTSTGTTSSWRNPDSGHSGSITPTRTVQNPDGTYCREYTQIIHVDGRDVEGHGRACREADGSWKIS